MTKRYWTGEVPTHCQVTGMTITDCFVDGKTKLGPWAFMHPAAVPLHGVGFGSLYGQKYRKQPDGRWLKVEG
jgi:hypothetical protein